MTDEKPGSGRDNRGRFTKGAVQNPKGRPKKVPDTLISPLEVLFARSVTLKTAGGTTRQMSATEAARHAVLQEAFKGKAAAITQVTDWVMRREKWRAAKTEKVARKKREKTSTTQFEWDRGNANDALLLLGIATRDREFEASVGTPGYRHLELETWAIQKALVRRRGSGPMDDGDIFEIERCAREPEYIRWPEGSRE